MTELEYVTTDITETGRLHIKIKFCTKLLKELINLDPQKTQKTTTAIRKTTTAMTTTTITSTRIKREERTKKRKAKIPTIT